VTDVLSSVGPPESAPDQRPASVVGAATTAAGWAAGVGLIAVTVVVLLAWAAEPRSGAPAGAALQLAADGWLLAHGVPLKVAGATFGLIPLALTTLPAYLLSRAGASVARAARVGDVTTAARATAVLTATYAVLAALVTGPAATTGVSASPLRAALSAGLLALVCGGAGVLRGSGVLHSSRLEGGIGVRPGNASRPESGPLAGASAALREAARGGAIAVAAVLAGAALVAGAALATRAGGVRGVFDALGTGVAGGIFLLLISLAYLPNLAIWSAAFLVGPGFAVGNGTGVGLFGVRLHPLPALPLLAALPAGPVHRWLLVLLAVPVAGGLLAGVAVGRRTAGGEVSRRRLIGTAAGTGPAAGLMLGLLCLLSGGPAGSGRLSAVGPSAWRVALVLAAEVGVPAAAVAWWTVRRLPGSGDAG